MSKEIFFDDKCREKLFNGAKKLSDAVKVTLGPGGRLVAFEDNGKITLTKDGVTVGKYVELEDKTENMGAKLLYEAASKTNAIAGDSTTTSTLLAYSIVKEGMKALNAGIKPIDLKKGIEDAAKDLAKELVEMSKKVETSAEITNVATISANNDPEIGSILAEAIEKVGKDGLVTVEESKSNETSVKTVEGLQIANGYINSYFANNRERMTAEYDKSYILVTDKKITSIQQLLPLLEKVGPTSQPLTIICDDMEGDALGTLILNQVRGSLKTLVVKAPSYGENRKAILEDVSILTGATFISDDNGNTLEKATLASLGTAKVKSTKEETIITCTENKEAVEKRVKELEEQIKSSEDKYIQEKYKARLARLTNKVAVICVGAATEAEMKEKKYRVDDTIAATRAALEEGIIPGGGVALANAATKLCKKDFEDGDVSYDYIRGYNLTLNAVYEPLKQIADNSGANGDVVLSKILDSDKCGFGYNAKTGNYGDMISFGVVDTTKAIRYALLNASSIASLLLVTSCSIAEKPKKEEPLTAVPAGGFNY